MTLPDLGARGIGPPAVLRAIAASLGLARPGSPVGSATELVATFDPGRMPVDPWWFDPDTLALHT